MNVGINLVVIPIWGMQAAAATTVLANAIMVGGAWFYSQRVYPVPYDWGRIARMLLIGATVVVAATAVSPQGHVAGVAWALAAWLVYVAALVATGTVTRGDVAAARAWAGAARLGLRAPRFGKGQA